MSSAPVPPAPPTITSLSAPYTPGAKWHLVRDDSITFPPPRSGRGVKGPRALSAMCLRVLADNIVSASAEMLDVLPTGLQRALWNELAPRTMPLATWSTISRVLLTDCTARAVPPLPNTPTHTSPRPDPPTLPLSALRFTQSLPFPPLPLPLPIYLTPLSTLPPTTLVHLRIDNISQTDTPSLVSLPALLPQLAVLELVEPEPGPVSSSSSDGGGARISDRLVRAWLRQEGFKALRVMRLLSKGQALGEGTVREVLGGLGRLVVLDVTVEGGSSGARRVGEVTVEGWRVNEAKAKTAPFASYVEGYFEGKVRVQLGVVGALERLFEDDRQPIEVVQCSRERRHQTCEGTKDDRGKDLGNDGKVDGGYNYRDQAASADSNPTAYLDDAWRELLEGKHPLVQPAPTKMEPPIDRAEVSDDRHQDEPLGDDNQDELSDDEVDDQDALLDDRDEWGDLPSNPFNNQTELFDDQAFWFLALLDQREYHRRAQETTARPATRAEVAGIALPRSQFVSLRLCCPGSLARRHREVLNSTRLIFTRSRPEKEEGAPVGEGPQAATVPPPRKHVRLSSDPAPSWALRADDRRTTNLKPRKKQKLADVFSGFGM